MDLMKEFLKAQQDAQLAAQKAQLDAQLAAQKAQQDAAAAAAKATADALTASSKINNDALADALTKAMAKEEVKAVDPHLVQLMKSLQAEKYEFESLAFDFNVDSPSVALSPPAYFLVFDRLKIRETAAFQKQIQPEDGSDGELIRRLMNVLKTVYGRYGVEESDVFVSTAGRSRFSRMFLQLARAYRDMREVTAQGLALLYTEQAEVLDELRSMVAVLDEHRRKYVTTTWPPQEAIHRLSDHRLWPLGYHLTRTELCKQLGRLTAASTPAEKRHRTESGNQPPANRHPHQADPWLAHLGGKQSKPPTKKPKGRWCPACRSLVPKDSSMEEHAKTCKKK